MKPKIKYKGNIRTYMLVPLILTTALALLNVPIYFLSREAGAFVSLFVVLYFLLVLGTYLYFKPRILNELIHFSSEYGTVQKKLLEEFEIAYALLDNNGKILWMNKEFLKLTGKDIDYRKSISTIYPAITKEIVQKIEKHQEVILEQEEKVYRASMSKIFFESAFEESDIIELGNGEPFLTALYLFDETKLNHFMSENQAQKLICGLVYIDNFEEALNSIEEVKRSLLVALVDRRVNQYFSKRDGLVKKLEKDKYFVVFKKQYIQDLIVDRFSLIEDVKTIKAGNEMPVTLSIGIGVMEDSYARGYEFARKAVDLALGRGGDQVVIKDGDETSYYGGKSRQVERMGKVKARVKAQALREIIDSKDRILIMGHKISDVDSFGAAIGIASAARALGKKPYIIINEVSSSVRPLKAMFTENKIYPADTFINNDQALELVNQNTVVMVVDINRPHMTECPEILNRTKTIVVFDHHRQSSDMIETPTLSYIESYASSTCEMVAEVLQYFADNIHLSTQEADAIYAGILIDTNNFMTKTGVRTFETAAYLRRWGADVTRVRKLLRNDMATYKAKAEAVTRAHVFRQIFAISVCPGEDVESPTIAGAQAANELLNISGIKASFVLTEVNRTIYISSRSIDEINVQLVMERLGGGGHSSMAGAQLTGYTIEEAMKHLEDTLDVMIAEGAIEYKI